MNATGLVSLILAVAVTIVPFGRGALRAQESSLKTVKVGGGSFTTSVAQANGIFARYGLQIQIPRGAAGGSEEVRRWLASGEQDLDDSGVDSEHTMVELTGRDVLREQER